MTLFGEGFKQQVKHTPPHANLHSCMLLSSCELRAFNKQTTADFNFYCQFIAALNFSQLFSCLAFTELHILGHFNYNGLEEPKVKDSFKFKALNSVCGTLHSFAQNNQNFSQREISATFLTLTPFVMQMKDNSMVLDCSWQ